MLSRLVTLLARPWAPLAAALIGVVLTLPALGAGLILDDYFHRAILLGVGPFGREARPAFDLFSFIPKGPRHAAASSIGLLTWWADPDLAAAFFRPLTALTHMLDYALWPNAIAVQHLHSLLWYGLAIFAITTLYRQVHGATAVAGLAAVLFAVDGAHTMCAGWLANRHVLPALAAGIFALQAHCRWRTGGGVVWAVVAVTGLAVALLCSEAGLGAAAYIVAWQLTMDDEPCWTKRVVALVPYAALVIGWHALYAGLGYGATGSALYIDPGQHFGDFVLALVERWPVLQLAQWLRVQCDLSMFVPRAWQIVWALLGGVACLVLVLVFRPLLSASREARFWAAGMSLALVPFCAAFPMDRLLLFSGVGAFALLALFIEREAILPRHAGVHSTRRTLALGLLVLHGPLAAVLLVQGVVMLPLLDTPLAAVAARSSAAEGGPRRSTVFVNGLEPFVAALPIVQALENPEAATQRVAILASMFNDNVVYREAEDTLVITAQGGFLRTAPEQLFRSARVPFRMGERIERADFTAEVRTLTPDGRPEQVAYLHHPLESSEYQWLVWSEQGVDEFRLPPMKSQVDLPRVRILPLARALGAARAKQGVLRQ